jgi:hypothetical protein
LIRFKHTGNFQRTENFLNKIRHKDFKSTLAKYGTQGVNALSSSTPVDSSLTANSWDYEIKVFRGGFKIIWSNSNVVDGIPVAILIQYGHGTRSGRFVEGRDFINPAMRPIFDSLVENLWKEVVDL